MNRIELIDSLIETYMKCLSDNPEVIRTVLKTYFDNFNNDELENRLKEFNVINYEAAARPHDVENIYDLMN
jgi:hypothetical protein